MLYFHKPRGKIGIYSKTIGDSKSRPLALRRTTCHCYRSVEGTQSRPWRRMGGRGREENRFEICPTPQRSGLCVQRSPKRDMPPLIGSLVLNPTSPIFLTRFVVMQSFLLVSLLSLMSCLFKGFDSLSCPFYGSLWFWLKESRFWSIDVVQEQEFLLFGTFYGAVVSLKVQWFSLDCCSTVYSLVYMDSSWSNCWLQFI